MQIDDRQVRRRARGRIARRRGALSGFLLIVLGAWAALVPFIGPWFNLAYTPDSSWQWTAARGWHEVLPGAVAVAAGLLVLFSARRSTAVLACWLAVAAGAWLVVGPALAPVLHTGSLGSPTGTGNSRQAAEQLLFFYAIGAAIVFVAAAAFGRLSVRSPADIRYAERSIEAERRAEDERLEAARRRDEEQRLAKERSERERLDRERAGNEPAASDRPLSDRPVTDRPVSGSPVSGSPASDAPASGGSAPGSSASGAPASGDQAAGRHGYEPMPPPH
ncbi:hypothetical protein M6D93_03795 [Jatrophihabitans telluris]|uniref:Uncharacterized protein n=1 Tax=Jatrophihabitans telluris TaxID=2038343 RepID=A0ABY4R1V3_9ACTN|nr:hypothetical protein [Jatrophihabitans telluris]UQX89131.1 hypothetical protein M6D93_03795 [Jatrophihabitans telluris]